MPENMSTLSLSLQKLNVRFIMFDIAIYSLALGVLHTLFFRIFKEISGKEDVAQEER